MKNFTFSKNFCDQLFENWEEIKRIFFGSFIKLFIPNLNFFY